MLTEEVKTGLSRMLKLSSTQDVEILEVKFVPGLPRSQSLEEATEAILRHVKHPSELLREKNIRRAIMVAYLEEKGIRIPKKHARDACIKMCLDLWDLKDDKFREKQHRSEIKNLGDLSDVGNYTNAETEDASVESLMKNNKLVEILESVNRQSALTHLNDDNENEVQVLSSTVVQSSAMELPSSSSNTSRLNSTNTHSEKKRKAASLITSDSVDVYGGPSTSYDCLPINNGDTDHSVSSRSNSSVNNSGLKRNPASLTASPESTVLFGGPSTSVFLEPFVPPSTAYKPERNQSISLSIPPRCASAPVYNDNQRHSNPLSSGEYISSTNLFPQQQSTEPFSVQQSTEPFSVSSQSIEMDSQLSESIVGNDRRSVSDTVNLSSASSYRICKTERESPEPPFYKPFGFSPWSVEMDDEQSVSINESSPVTSFTTSSYQDCKGGRKSSKTTRLSRFKQLVSSTSLSDASVQTMDSELPEFLAQRYAAFQTNRSSIMSSEKDDEVLPSNENLRLLPRKTLKRRLPTPKKCAPPKSKDLPSLPKRKNIGVGVSEAKRNKRSPLLDPEDNVSDCRNVNLSQPSSSVCLNYKKQSFSSSPHTDGNETQVQSRPLVYKKKRLSAVPRQVDSTKKLQRLPLPSKPGKSATVFSHASQRPPTSLVNTKVRKRKCLIRSVNEEIDSSRQKSMLSSGYRKQSKVAFKKVNCRVDNALAESENEGETQTFLTKDEDSFSSKQKALGSESTTDYMHSKNSSDEVTKSPSRPSCMPEALLREDDSTLKTSDSSSETSDEDKRPSTESSGPTYVEKPLPRPRKHCCTLL